MGRPIARHYSLASFHLSSIIWLLCPIALPHSLIFLGSLVARLHNRNHFSSNLASRRALFYDILRCSAMASQPPCPVLGRALPPRRGATACSQQEALDALARYQAQGKGLDPSNPEHVRAYLTLRATSARVAPGKILNYVRNAQEKVAVGKREEMAIWAVPVQNFPQGPPDWMRDNVKTVDELVEECLVSGTDIDVSGWYLIDRVAPR